MTGAEIQAKICEKHSLEVARLELLDRIEPVKGRRTRADRLRGEKWTPPPPLREAMRKAKKAEGVPSVRSVGRVLKYQLVGAGLAVEVASTEVGRGRGTPRYRLAPGVRPPWE